MLKRSGVYLKILSVFKYSVLDIFKDVLVFLKLRLETISFSLTNSCKVV